MRCRRQRRRRNSAVAMVEFALVGPLFFLLVLGIFVLAIVVKNQVGLSNAVRDIARAAAVCGSQAGNSSTAVTLPDGTSCTNIESYANTKLTAIDPSLKDRAIFSVYPNCGTSTSPTCPAGQPCCGAPIAGPTTTPGTAAQTNSVIGSCEAGVAPDGTTQNPYTVEVSVQYAQPLYLPLIGYVFGDGGTNTRQITATGDATCEE